MGLTPLVLLGFVSLQEPTLLKVIYNPGNASLSVGILNDAIVQEGDLYRQYQVRGFDINAIILEESESREAVKLVETGDVSKDLYRRARNFFVAKQMKAIYEAQIKYHHGFLLGYASSLEALMHHEFLDNGFEKGKKEKYFFSIVETQYPYGKEPKFLALAEPLTGENDFFFSVDELGQVRYAETKSSVRWGPVWDYMDQTPVASKDIGLKER